MAGTESEAIFWTHINPGANAKERERVSFKDGEKIVERVPQRGHQGDYENRRPARGVRYVPVVRTEGFLINMVVTSGAAHMDHTTSFGQYQFAKARTLGWYFIGACPCALVLTGELKTEHLVDQKLAKAKPCEPGSYSTAKPCPHALAEKLAREAAHAPREAKRMAGFKDATEKLVDASTAQTAAIVGAITDALGKAKS